MMSFKIAEEIFRYHVALQGLSHWGMVTYICIGLTMPTFFLIMAFHLKGVKPLYEAMLTYFKLYPWKLQSNFDTFLLEERHWKYYLFYLEANELKMTKLVLIFAHIVHKHLLVYFICDSSDLGPILPTGINWNTSMDK